jgi:hypothetical protein
MLSWAHKDEKLPRKRVRMGANFTGRGQHVQTFKNEKELGWVEPF